MERIADHRGSGLEIQCGNFRLRAGSRPHGAATVAALADFYDTVVMLFDGSKLGGATLTARKPAAS